MLRLLGGKRYRKRGRPKFFVDFLMRGEDRRISRLPFYRIHPYQGRMPLRGADQACVVDMENEIFFHRIPKNANSSLVTSVAQLMEGNERSTAIKDKRALKKLQVRPSSLTKEEAEKVDGYFKFLVCRNPYDRTLSAYLSKIVRRAKLEKPSKVYGKKSPASAFPSFGEFCEYVAGSALYKNRHWSPQVDFLVYPKERYDFTVRLESIDEDFAALAERLGRPSPGVKMITEDPKHHTGAAARRQEFYTDALYDLIYETYRADFETFGYRKSDR